MDPCHTIRRRWPFHAQNDATLRWDQAGSVIMRSEGCKIGISIQVNGRTVTAAVQEANKGVYGFKLGAGDEDGFARCVVACGRNFELGHCKLRCE